MHASSTMGKVSITSVPEDRHIIMTLYVSDTNCSSIYFYRNLGCTGKWFPLIQKEVHEHDHLCSEICLAVCSSAGSVIIKKSMIVFCRHGCFLIQKRTSSLMKST